MQQNNYIVKITSKKLNIIECCYLYKLYKYLSLCFSANPNINFYVFENLKNQILYPSIDTSDSCC